MTRASPIRMLLGPQRPLVNLRDAVAAAGVPAGSLAVISAGWQEAEGVIDDVREAVGRDCEDIGLYARAESVFAADPALAEAYRLRQNLLKEQQRLYRQRLKQLAIAARNALRAKGHAEMIKAEQQHAIAQLRALDKHHLQRTEQLHDRFASSIDPSVSPVLADHISELRDRIDAAAAVLITGGNVVVLLNRIRLFALAEMLTETQVIGWSAGAMVLASRVVLFHDRTPEGRRDAEVLGAGTGLAPGYVVLPDGRRRLRRRDVRRTELMSRRFAPDTCVVLDSGAALGLESGKVVVANGAKRLDRKGHHTRVRAA